MGLMVATWGWWDNWDQQEQHSCTSALLLHYSPIYHPDTALNRGHVLQCSAPHSQLVTATTPGTTSRVMGERINSDPEFWFVSFIGEEWSWSQESVVTVNMWRIGDCELNSIVNSDVELQRTVREDFTITEKAPNS